MKRAAAGWPLAAVLLTACGTAPTPNTSGVDIADAASDAQNSVAAYDASRRRGVKATPSPVVTAPPSPIAGAGVPDIAIADYSCADGTRWRARFDNRTDRVALDGAGSRVTLAGRRPASGIWYAADGWELRGKGDAATLTRPGAGATDCTARE